MGDLKTEGWMIYKQVADYLSVSTLTVRRWVEDNKLPRPISLADGTKKFFIADEIKQWLLDETEKARSKEHRNRLVLS